MENKLYIYENYNKLSTKIIAENLNITETSVRRIAKNLGVTKRKFYENEIKDFLEIPNFNNYIINVYGVILRKKDKLIIKTNIDNWGYVKVKLTNNEGLRKSLYVHRLVMITFKGYSNLPVNHIDGLKTNNHINNLEYVTHSDNLKHAYSLKLRESLVGNKNNRAKYSEEQIKTVCKLLEKYKSPKIVYDFLEQKINLTVIQQIYSKRRWKHISKNYNF